MSAKNKNGIPILDAAPDFDVPREKRMIAAQTLRPCRRCKQPIWLQRAGVGARAMNEDGARHHCGANIKRT